MILSTPKWLKDLAGAWIFYSILPGWPWIKPRFKRIARFAPWIGLLLGALQSGTWILLSHLGWPITSSCLASIALGAFLTGGLHIDGLMDTADGIAAGKTRCLEAMKDSRVGSSGVQILLLITLIQIATLFKLGSYAPFAFPIAAFWGRCAPLWAINNFSYLSKSPRKNSFHQNTIKSWNEALPALQALLLIITTITLIPLDMINKINLINCILIGIFPTILIPHLLGLYLGGHTGDSYGASLILVETFIFLILASAL